MTDWLTVHRGEAPLVIGLPHTGTDIPPEIEVRLLSPWLARKDADWWIDLLYDFAAELGATIVRTAISRTVIDVNRDPSGVSLYPGQATTGLCPVETFDGEPLYRAGDEPDEGEIAARRESYFDPYHAALAVEIARLRERYANVVLYDAHSIRSIIPRLFDGELPNFNVGTFGGRSCSPDLQDRVTAHLPGVGRGPVTVGSTLDPGLRRGGVEGTAVVNGRFKGGWTTRHYGDPAGGVHAIQMELACRGYMAEPADVNETNWPAPYDPAFAAPMRAVLRDVLSACVAFAKEPA